MMPRIKDREEVEKLLDQPLPGEEITRETAISHAGQRDNQAAWAAAMGG